MELAVSGRADSGRRVLGSYGDREAAESGLLELAVEPALNIEAVDGRSPAWSFE